MIETIVQLPDPNFPLPFQLYSAGITHPDPHYKIRRENPNLFVLEYVVSGCGHLRIDDISYTVGAGDVYLLQPFLSQEYHSDANNPWEKIWFNLNGPLIANLVDSYSLKSLVVYRNCPLEEEFRAALETIRKRERNAHTELSIGLHRIFAGMAEWREQHPESRKSSEGLLLKEYLDRNWRKEIPLEELAGLVGRSVSQTIRIFRKDWQTTPCQYIQNQRYRLARQYLENSDCKIAVIANIVGFKDEFYFSNWFKLRSGLSPARYKRKML